MQTENNWSEREIKPTGHTGNPYSSKQLQSTKNKKVNPFYNKNSIPFHLRRIYNIDCAERNNPFFEDV